MSLRKGFNKQYFEWDIQTWQVSQKLWIRELDKISGPKKVECIEIGSRAGRLSVWLADYFGNNCKVVCSDLSNPEKDARIIHELYNVSDLVDYSSQNVMNLNFPDASFDIVIFKSVLGALGSDENIRIAIKEIHRVLKSDGLLLFAENTRSTYLHVFLRKSFNKWSKDYWYYPSYNEFLSYLNGFKIVELDGNGFFACFYRKAPIKSFLVFLDWVVVRFIPLNYRYMLYGVAKK